MRALLDDPALVHHDDLVGLADRREAVGDDERGPAPQQAPQRRLDQALGLGVDAARRLVQDQDARIGQQGAGEGEQLPLPDREADAALLDLGLVAVAAGRR